jgi:sigma-E factor negative regulatory protein RseC
MPRIGYVLETAAGTARIVTTRRGICAGCSERSSCSFENALGKDVPEEVTARNPVGAKPGDTVEFDLPGHTELKVSLLVWVVPLAGMIAGAVAGANLHRWLSLGRDPATLLGAVAGSALAFAGVILCDRRASRDERLVPSVLKVVPPSSCSGLPVRQEISSSDRPASP